MWTLLPITMVRIITQDGKEAALGLKPFGDYAFFLFSAGLFNTSIFAARILPLSTAYSVCEGLELRSRCQVARP